MTIPSHAPIAYGITYLAKSGLRTLFGAAQGRNLSLTIAEAKQRLLDHYRQDGETRSGEDRLCAIVGEQARGTFGVSPFEVWVAEGAGFGDPKGIYADEVELVPNPQADRAAKLRSGDLRVSLPSLDQVKPPSPLGFLVAVGPLDVGLWAAEHPGLPPITLVGLSAENYEELDHVASDEVAAFIVDRALDRVDLDKLLPLLAKVADVENRGRYESLTSIDKARLIQFVHLMKGKA